MVLIVPLSVFSPFINVPCSFVKQTITIATQRKELLIRLTVFSRSFGCFPLRFRGRDYGSYCTSSWSLLNFYF